MPQIMHNIISKIKRYVNFNELIFDGMILITIFFLQNLIIPDGKSVIDLFNQEIGLSLIISIQFFVVIYLGLIYSSYDYYIVSDRVMIVVYIVFFLVINGLFVGIVLGLEIYKVVPLQNLFGDDARIIIMGILIYTLLLGGVTSFPFNELFDKYEKLMYVFYLPGLLGIVLIPVSLISIIMKSTWYFGLIVFLLASGLMTWIIILKKNLLTKQFKELPIIKTINLLGKNIILPAITSFIMVLWQELYLLTMIKSSIAVYNTVSFKYVMISLIVSGLIPLRLIENFAPPYRPINTIIAIITFILYIQELSSIIMRFSG